jgi:hypothetical protein
MAGVVASRGFQSWTFLRADWRAGRRRAEDAEWVRPVRVCGDLQYIRNGARGRTGRSDRRRTGAAMCRVVAWRGYLADQLSSRAAASHALRRCAILVADSYACCIELHGERCTLHGVWCMLQRVLRTMHVCLMLHGVRTCYIVVFHCCRLRLYDTCLPGQWDGPCCSRMLRIACCMLHVCALRIARWMLRNACCIRASAVFCDRNDAAVGVVRVACCMPYVACRNGRRVDVRCMTRIVRCASLV